MQNPDETRVGDHRPHSQARRPEEHVDADPREPSFVGGFVIDPVVQVGDLRGMEADVVLVGPLDAVVDHMRDPEGLPRDGYRRCEPVSRANAPRPVA